MNDSRKVDRRSLRSQQLLHRALMALMLEKRYDKITVQEIIDRAAVGRSTFYAHYRDKEELLISNFEQMLETFSGHWLAPAAGQADGPPEPMSVAGLFRHAQEFHELYKALVWGRGIDLIYQQAQNYLCRRVEQMLRTMIPVAHQPTMPLPLLANHIATTLGALLRWWLEAEMPYTPEEMDSYFHQLVRPVLQEVLGGDATPPP